MRFIADSLRRVANAMFILSLRFAQRVLTSKSCEFREVAVRKVLVYGYCGLGNFILLTPALESLKSHLRNASFTLLHGGDTGVDVVARNKGLFEDYIECRKGVRLSDLRTILRIRSERYDLILGNFNADRRFLAMLTAFSGAKVRVTHSSSPGWKARYDAFYNIRVAMRQDQHEVDRNFELLYALGLSPEVIHPSVTFPLRSDMRDFAEAKLKEIAGNKQFKRVISVQVGSSSDEWWKRWPLDRYARLCDMLVERGNLVIAHGSPSERETVFEMIGMMRNKIANMAGETTIEQAAAILGRSDLLVCNDSGLMHLAAAVGTPVVAIYGPTDYTRTSPVGKSHRILRNDIECSPCFKLDGDTTVKNCKYQYKCLSLTEVNEVINEIERSAEWTRKDVRS